MASNVTFGFAHFIGMVAGGLLAHLAVQTFHDKSTIVITWGDKDVAQLQAPRDVLQHMYPFFMIKKEVHLILFDEICYKLQTLYSILASLSSGGTVISHEQVYACQGLAEAVVSLAGDFVRLTAAKTPEALTDIERAYDNLEQTLEKEMNSLRYIYEQSLLQLHSNF